MNAPTTNRTLILLRHAKSDWPGNAPDHERPLAERGRRDAPAMGRWLRDSGYRPDRVLCSTALRTRQTWDLVRDELGDEPPTEFEPRVYGATVQELLDVIAGAPAEAGTVLVIGHNPGLEYLSLTLAGDAPTEERERLRVKFPTASAAVFEWSGAWNEVAAGKTRLVRFMTPHDL
ncbi:histidine phosphatase family protein [Actinospica sp. MGRD01-02]|uniref:Histidine phosphatase family protein n=1 Tax=Actinospica acidithermotolerans TaxID=2828514 RepID=A0A941EL19_9ACTN|nr:histidine phosphatase family protein [Actinospica acidithermotolerans]MBR7829534.1 histidine phosphatase family protein [Actinospica acidithermotolerans]